MEKTPGILIGLNDLTETSLIVRWCTREFGLVRTAARGARRKTSAFRGKLDLFFDAELAFVRSRRSDLHGLCEVEVSSVRLGLRQSYLRTLAASYFVKLIELVVEPETPIDAQYGLLGRALDFLAREDPYSRAVLHFEKELAAGLGLKGARSPIAMIGSVYGRIPSLRRDLLAHL